MTEKADALFDHSPGYTFRQLMSSYRYWKSYVRRHRDYVWCIRETGARTEYNYEHEEKEIKQSNGTL